MIPWLAHAQHTNSTTTLSHISSQYFQPLSSGSKNNLSLIKVHCKIMHSFIIRRNSGHTQYKHKLNGYSAWKIFSPSPSQTHLSPCSLTIVKYFFITINKMEIGQNDGDEHDFSFNSSCAFDMFVCVCAGWWRLASVYYYNNVIWTDNIPSDMCV